MKDYYMPRYRYEFIEWLRNRFPDDERKFHKMRLDQLIAIYCSVMEQLRNV